MRRRPFWLPVVLGLAGCSLVAGIRDYRAPAVTDGGAGTGGAAGGGSGGGSGATAGTAGTGGQCSADTLADPKNCGRCGHDCLGGACKAGQCQAMTLHSASSANASLFAINSDSVFWVQNYPAPAIIMSVPKTGGSPHTIASLNTNAAIALTADAQNVYWTAEGGSDGGPCSSNPSTCQLVLRKVAISGGTPQQIASVQLGSNTPRGIAVDDQAVYFGDDDLGLQKVALSGGTPTTIGQGRVVDMATDATNVYWTTGSAVMKAPKSGGATETVASGLSSALRIAADTSGAYWITFAGTNGVLWAGTNSSTPLGTPEVMAAGQIAGDGKDVYWADLTSSSTGKLLRVSEADGTTDTLISGPPVSKVAVDSAAIYWLEANHAASTGPYSIRKLAK